MVQAVSGNFLFEEESTGLPARSPGSSSKISEVSCSVPCWALFTALPLIMNDNTDGVTLSADTCSFCGITPRPSTSVFKCVGCHRPIHTSCADKYRVSVINPKCRACKDLRRSGDGSCSEKQPVPVPDRSRVANRPERPVASRRKPNQVCLPGVGASKNQEKGKNKEEIKKKTKQKTPVRTVSVSSPVTPIDTQRNERPPTGPHLYAYFERWVGR